MESERTVSHSEALLAWVNSFDLVGEPKQIAELSDGRIIWDILHDIDPERFPDVTDPKKSNLENLVTIHGRLQYNILDLRKSEGWPRGLDPEPNLIEFAENNSARDAEKLLKLVFFAATITAKGNTASYETYGDAIQKLDSPIQESLQDFLENVEEGQYELDDLARESRESQLVKTIEELKQENTVLREKYVKTEQRVLELEYAEENYKSELEFMKERIEVLKSGKGEFGFSKRDLDQKTEEIAALEEQLFIASEQNGKLSSRIDELLREAKDYQAVRDKLDIEKNNYANANRNAKFAAEQKSKEIEMLQTKNQNLEAEKKELKKQVLEYDVQVQRLNDQLRESNNALARSEREAREMSITKGNVDLDNEELRRRLEGAEKEIHDLKGRIGELEGIDDEYSGTPRSRTPTTGVLTPGIQGNLQKDLEAAGFEESTLSIGEEEHTDFTSRVEEGPGEELNKENDEQQLAMKEEDKAKLLQEMLKPLEEAKEQLAQFISQQTGAGSEAIQQSLEELTKQISDLIEKDHERLAQRAQYIHQQNEQIKVLRERISELETVVEEANAAEREEDTVSKERERALEKQLDALTRELALMSSAWYELQSKLHSTNNVPTSRYRHGSAGLVDAQKSWLARQRSAVAGP
ncbi:hypothetical protein AN5126.2 [Aspergillus nidulans FGSC A4]|uniref:Microtubule binding protein HOOK3, putative (AFU_orthologue AFUA_1G07490) n=1 Tax=Emericella nidulans (strain FGSC A4 / ATCC 38163 / CBS 112.46 / NRRL 194 / M139) TaxID=227321 RepID=Q5B2V4_EMENI|nr:protein HookA [Aspergillus nidulans FGSC A4]EAA62307.1 hypothetical protein AN5126.2 [Aspergillus nidulans FGSC A4]CBF80909.1 TPA: microtubule binding protein HOOK3, putative (AFU_orthologue; AFUA_1G07490) [Aspergillus nidulans FGSC A4]|eukprot:XP_662730.1 hypothetical protein AN5126.2 [Aspergillus nidulans FGSC A4]